MTPEERWIKIENAIHSLVDTQGQHATQIAENSRQIAENSRLIAENSRQIAKVDKQVEKNSDAIRDLIVVSRTVIEAQQQLHSEIKTQLELLVKAVDAFVQGLRKPNGSQ
jgi:hypothetical protein